jgi:diketogulonate reductase-like aldo/keto reductase
VQNHYNIVHRHDDALIDELAGSGVAYVPFFPLGGFTPLQSSTLSEVATRRGATPMQVALAWLLHRAPNILLIPGTSSIAHLHENLAAAELALTDTTLAELGAIDGERLSASAVNALGTAIGEQALIERGADNVMSALGHKRTLRGRLGVSALHLKADMLSVGIDVC